MTAVAKPLPDKLPILERAAIELTPHARADGTADPDRFDITISSETPCENWFGREILDHQRSSVDLTRFKRGLPLRLVEVIEAGSHRMGVQVGIVEEPEIDEKARVLRGVARFSRNAVAQETKKDVEDKIRRFLSVSYRVQKMVLESDDKDKGPTYRATRWMPMEVAIVPVPADVTVGFGRSADGSEQPVELTGAREATPGSTATMDPTPAASPTPTPAGTEGARAAAAAAPVTVVDLAGERKRISDIITIANTHKIGDAARVSAWINSDRSVDSIKGEILDLKARGALPQVAPTDAARQGQDQLQLTEKEQREYSFCRAILACADRDRDLAPFEYEVHDEIVKKRGESKRGGIYVPANLAVNPLAREVRERVLAALPQEIRAEFLSRAALDTATATKGAELKFVEPGPFIELLRNKMLVRTLGARILTGLQGDVSFPRQTGAGTFFWVPESPTADVTASNLLLNSLTLAPKIGQSTTSYSRKLLAQSVRDVDMLVREDMALINALGIDLAAINGAGTSNQPTGILNTAGIGSVAIGANGGVPIYDTAVDLESQVAIANADLGALAYLTTPLVRGRYKKSAQISATTGIPVWWQGEVNGYNAQASQQVPSNLTKGTSTTITHAIIFGNWNEVLIGQWGELEIIADPYSQKKRGDIEVTTFIMADVGLRHAASMAACKDALP